MVRSRADWSWKFSTARAHSLPPSPAIVVAQRQHHRRRQQDARVSKFQRGRLRPLPPDGARRASSLGFGGHHHRIDILAADKTVQRHRRWPGGRDAQMAQPRRGQDQPEQPPAVAACQAAMRAPHRVPRRQRRKPRRQGAPKASPATNLTGRPASAVRRWRAAPPDAPARRTTLPSLRPASQCSHSRSAHATLSIRERSDL